MAAAVNYSTFGDEIVYENRNGVERDYMRDPLGNTIALLDNTQAQTDTFTYWPYGEVRTRTGTSAMPFQFVGVLGYCLDNVSGFLYVRARHLLTQVARWLTLDPQWPSELAYAYVSNRPVFAVDPSGAKGVYPEIAPTRLVGDGAGIPFGGVCPMNPDTFVCGKLGEFNFSLRGCPSTNHAIACGCVWGISIKFYINSCTVSYLINDAAGLALLVGIIGAALAAVLGPLGVIAIGALPIGIFGFAVSQCSHHGGGASSFTLSWLSFEPFFPWFGCSEGYP